MTLVQRASQVKPLSVEPEQQTTFTAFPKGTLLEAGNVPIAEIGERGDAPTRPEWRLFAQEYLEETPTGVKRYFKAASKGDRMRYGRARSLLENVEKAGGGFAPSRAIPTDGRSLPLSPRSGPGPGKRNRAPGLALCDGGSLDREPQENIGRGLALNP